MGCIKRKFELRPWNEDTWKEYISIRQIKEVKKTTLAERKTTYLSNLIDKEIADGDKTRSFQILLRISQSGNSSYTMKTIALPNMNNYPKLGVPENRVLYSPFTPYSDDTEYIIDLDQHIIETDLMLDIYGTIINR